MIKQFLTEDGGEKSVEIPGIKDSHSKGDDDKQGCVEVAFPLLLSLLHKGDEEVNDLGVELQLRCVGV